MWAKRRTDTTKLIVVFFAILRMCIEIRRKSNEAKGGDMAGKKDENRSRKEIERNRKDRNKGGKYTGSTRVGYY